MHATSSSVNPAQAEIPLVDLLRRVAGRDRQPFQQLYDRTAQQVYSMALTVVRDNHRADRITQQVYRDVWWRAAEFDASAGSVESWLTLLTRARLVDDLRHSRRERGVRPDASTESRSAAEVWLR
ncbi:MAG: sigma factor, partial [Nakamurella sp.]